MVRPGISSTASGVREGALLAKLDTIGAQATAWRIYAEKLRAAIGWVEQPFADENTSADELRQRVRFMLEDTGRADFTFNHDLRVATYGVAAADTSGTTDQTREDQ